MSEKNWHLTFEIFRQKVGKPSHYDVFPMEVNPDEFVLDVVERIWAFNDRSLTFRHACHHSTCGACGMRVNGVEKLTCITPIYE
ncbi:MAG: 2Fe-2S iron-sulfur cluster-binding protein, partial [Anaerolineaceae bacterium]